MDTSVFKQIKNAGRNRITFQMTPTRVAYANTLRRLMTTNVECVGFCADIKDTGESSDVQILANSTPMTNEMLAHRIGLLAIHVPNPLEWDPDQYIFEIDVVNDSDKSRDVKASDFTVYEVSGETKTIVPTNRFFPQNPITGDTCLIAILKEKMPGGKPEELKIKAKATVGFGKENARFIPTSQAAYSYTIDMDPKRMTETFNNWVQAQKKIQPESLDTDKEKKATLMREFQTLEMKRCWLKDETGEPYSFDFTVESVGVLTPEYIVKRACEAGKLLCAKFAMETLPEDVLVQPGNSRHLSWDFVIPHQDHTLGHLLQAWLDETKVGNGEIDYVGYDQIHPLKDELLFRIGVVDEKEETARKVFREAALACSAMFELWSKDWNNQTQGTKVATTATATSATSATPGRQLKRAIQRPSK